MINATKAEIAALTKVGRDPSSLSIEESKIVADHMFKVSAPRLPPSLRTTVKDYPKPEMLPWHPQAVKFSPKYHPSIGRLYKKQFGWLVLAYWDPKCASAGCKRMWCFHIAAADGNATDALDLKKERITLYITDLAGRERPAHPRMILRVPSGTTIRLDYPSRRRSKSSPIVSEYIVMPQERRQMQLIADEL